MKAGGPPRMLRFVFDARVVFGAVVAVAVVSFAALLSLHDCDAMDAVGTDRGTLPTRGMHELSAGGSAAGTIRSNPEGSKHASVLAMAMGYEKEVYRSFIGSLRMSGFEGSIILGVSSPLKDGVEEYLNANSVTYKFMRFVNCTFDPEGKAHAEAGSSRVKEQSTCAHPYEYIKLRWGRFPLLRDWLEECEGCTGPVLVTDFRDTFFQRDPFGIDAPPVEGLQVFQEHRTQTTAHWITKVPIEKCKGMDFSKDPWVKPMLCSGTTIGTRDAMLMYLRDMHTEMKAWMKDPKCCCNSMNGDDQSIHNYLFHTGKLPYATAIPNRMGIVHTAGVQGALIQKGHKQMKAMSQPLPGAEGSDQWIGLGFDLTDEEGFFIDFNGERSRVVHQYDRVGEPFFKFRDKNKGKLWDLLIKP